MVGTRLSKSGILGGNPFVPLQTYICPSDLHTCISDLGQLGLEDGDGVW